MKWTTNMDSELEFLNSQKPYPLNLGSSFRRKQSVGFHTIRYDFKPASVDKGKEGCIEVGEGNEVTVTLPHVAGSKQSCTVYKGSKKPMQKECVLIYDHDTGELTLERITSQLQVKKTRMSGNIPAHTFPVLAPAAKVPKLVSKKTPTAKPPARQQTVPKTETDDPIMPTIKHSGLSSPAEEKLVSDAVDEEMIKAINSEDDSQSSSSSSSGSSSESGSDSSDAEEEGSKHSDQPQGQTDIPSGNLKDDLLLSDSGSDSD